MTIKQQGGIFGRNPSFNDVDVSGEINLSGDMNVSDGNKVIVGNDADVQLANFSDFGQLISDKLLIQDKGGKVYAYAQSGGSIQLRHNDAARLETAAGGVSITGNVIMASGNGIDFSATSGTGTSELFDDYEEGTWTPLFSDGTNNATMGLSNGGSYTKIGNLVTVTAYAQMSSKGSMSGNVRLTGLPYTVGSSIGGGGVGFADFLSITAGQSIGLWTQASGTYLNVTLFDGANGTSNLQASEMQNDGQFVFTLSYQT